MLCSRCQSISSLLVIYSGPPPPPHLILRSQARRVQLNDSKTGILRHFRSSEVFLSGDLFVRSFYLLASNLPSRQPLKFALLG